MQGSGRASFGAMMVGTPLESLCRILTLLYGATGIQIFASFSHFFGLLYSVLSTVLFKKCFQFAALLQDFAIHFCPVTLLQSFTEGTTWAVHCFKKSHITILTSTDSPWLFVLLCDTSFIIRQCRLRQPQKFDPSLGAGICRPNLNKFPWGRHRCRPWS